MPTTTRPDSKSPRKIDRPLSTRQFDVKTSSVKSRFCYYIPADGYVKGQGYRVSLVVEGEHGHYPTGNWPYEGKVDQTMPYFWSRSYETSKQIAAEENGRLGLTEKDVEDIIASSVGK